MRFADPWWLLALLLLPVMAWLRSRTGRESAFLYSSLTLVKGITQLSRSRAGAFLVNLRWLALALVDGGRLPADRLLLALLVRSALPRRRCGLADV